MTVEPGLQRYYKGIPRSVWALGFVSMLMDISSEMIHALLPLYLVTVLGISALAVGLIEGIAEATAMIVKIFSGALSDWLGRRKVLAVLGYGLGALSKPIFPLASGIGWLVGARFIDRVGKGTRGAPRDALVADLAPADLRGASFGLRQSLDTIGSFTGPLLAMLLMALTLNSFTTVFWIAVIPAFASVALLIYAVKEPERIEPATQRPKLKFSDAKRLGRKFWPVVGIAALLTLARFSEAFLLLKAQNIGLPLAMIPIVLVVMNIAYMFSAYPAGVMSDRVGRRVMLFIGLGFLVIADLFLAFGTNYPMLALGVVFWGLHMGFTESLLATMVADTAPADLRGTAFGVYNLACGIALLLASVIAGALWDSYGPMVTFIAGATFAAASALALLWVGTAEARDQAS